MRSELEGRKCFNFERMPTDLATLFSTLLIWEWKFNHESIKTPKYFALTHDNIGKLLTSQLRCFSTFAGQSFNILIVVRASGLKATSSEA